MNKATPTADKTQSISPLRQRMIEDMSLRKLSPRTQEQYLRAVRNLAEFLGHSPAKASAEDVRAFKLTLVNNGCSRGNLNAIQTGLQFFFKWTVQDESAMAKVHRVPEPRKIPVILSQAEVKQFLGAVSNIKYRAAFSVAYGAGLRISEIVALKVSDIDSQRMIIRVEQGKGGGDRHAMLSPTLLRILREWWCIGRQQNLHLNGGWLFPGQNPVNHVTARQLSRACQAVVKACGIDKRITTHTLRHCFATHLLEQGVDIRVIQQLLGHRQLEMTAFYTQVATTTLRETISPLDHLSLQTLHSTDEDSISGSG